jgi:hypothetical protein
VPSALESSSLVQLHHWSEALFHPNLALSTLQACQDDRFIR